MFTAMKRNILLFTVSLVFNLALQAQNLENNNDVNPRTKVEVNKHYDEKGNLIRYDSSYTFSYYNNIELLPADSLVKYLRRQFDGMGWPEPFSFRNDLLLPDNLIFGDFFRVPRFGTDQPKMLFDQMQEMMRRLENIRQSFLEELEKHGSKDLFENHQNKPIHKESLRL